MARLFCCGFELSSNSADEVANVSASSATSTTSGARSGARCGRLTSLASATRAGWAAQFVSALSSGPYYCRVAVKVDTAPSAANAIIAWIAGANVTSTSTNDGAIKLNANRTLTLFANASQIGSASSALTLGQWHYIEMEYNNTPASGSKVLRAYLDGVLFAGTTTSTNVGGTTNGMAVGGNLFAEAQTQGDWSFDDWVVNDNTGSAQTGLPGDGKLLMLRPNAAGDSNGWANTANGAGSSTNWQLVDENPPNSSTDLVQSATLNTLDLYGMDASGLGASDPVTLVAVYAVSQNNVADAATAFTTVLRKTSGGTQAQGTALVVNNTAWRTGSVASGNVLVPNQVAYTDPDAAAWTQSTLDSMQAGLKITTGGTNRIQVTALWAYVDYTESTAQNYTPTAGPDAAAIADTAVGTFIRPRAAGPDTAAIGDSAAGRLNRPRTAGPDAAAIGDSATADLQPPTLVGSLVDDFTDGTIDTTRWPGNYGSVAETGGRARIDCDAGQWSGLKSGTVYTLAGSQVSARVYPAAANTATVAYLSTLITTTTAGTSAGFNIDTASSGIAYLNQAGFSDPSAVFGTYDPVAHAWLRLRESAGTLYWETSPDGVTWTVRRSGSSPSWATRTDLALLFESHRDAGTDNYAEVDSVNVQMRAAADAVAAADTAAAALSRARTTGPDSAGLVDTATAELRHITTAGPDTAGIGDTAAARLNRTRSPADTAGIVDTAAAALSRARTTGPDVAGIGDTAAARLNRTRSPADTAGLVDTAAWTADTHRNPADEADLADTATGALHRIRSRADTAGITDTAAAVLRTVKVVADVAGIGDTAAAAVGQREQVTDVAAIGDTAAAALARTRTLNAPAGIVDQVTAKVGARMQVGDVAAIGDTVTAAITQREQVADVAAIGDTATARLARTRTLNAPAGIVDQRTHVLARYRTAADTVATADFADVGEGLLPGRIDDTAALTDQVRAALARPRAVADSAGIGDIARVRSGVPVHAHEHGVTATGEHADIAATGNPAGVADTTASAGVGRTA